MLLDRRTLVTTIEMSVPMTILNCHLKKSRVRLVPSPFPNNNKNNKILR